MRMHWLHVMIAAPLLGALPCAAGNFSVSTRGDVRDCSDIEIEARGRRVATAEETLTLPQPRVAERLMVEGSKNGGVYVVAAPGASTR